MLYRSVHDWDRAIAAFSQVIVLDTGMAEAHCYLGLSLESKRKYRAAVQALRRGHELGSKRSHWALPSAAWLKEAKELAGR